MNKRSVVRIIPAVALILVSVPALVGAKGGYTEPENFKQLKTYEFVNKAGSDSSRLQELIDGLPDHRGIILLKSSDDEYALGGIVLASDIHIRMEPGVRIRKDNVKGANVFNLTGENMSIVGASPSDKAVIAVDGDSDNPDQQSFRAFGAKEVTNFWIANIFIDEKDTRFSTIMTQNTASDGTIENITMTGAGPGWGLLQMQGGANIIARNLDGQGGFTLRLEQGSATAPGGIQNLQASNIIGRHGRAAVLIAPKSAVNGKAVIENVTSYGCQWAVHASSGKEDGVFENVLIKGKITARYDDHGSQFRTLSRKMNNVQFLPEDIQKKVTVIPGYGRNKFSTGASSGAVKVAPVDWIVIDKDAVIERRGFPFKDPDIITDAYYLDIISKKGNR
ncbi:hypothetical protein [Pontiella sulfatireligans]|uniref:Iota-carrageenase n=1 Tax=Pontiella sulfatireligans TaxID=2750658 RepID=A0A6C2UE14_9BACT|nr:hypothetical protein [Pontiella sulfatireligans]VGO18093.1 Iota-carrageenase [Pontiella sulfatireligans]